MLANEGFFKSQDFKIRLVYYGMNGTLANRTGDILLSMFSQASSNGMQNLQAAEVREFSNFLQSRRKKGEIEPEFRLVTNAFGQIKRNIKRCLTIYFGNGHTRSMVIYNSMNSGNKYLNIKIGQVLELFDLGGYVATGGENPRIFIRINDPFRLRSESNKKYENSYLKDIIDRHVSGVNLMKVFFETEMSSNDRWNFIEDYLLGHKN